jgi:hypothetical protein
MLRNRCKFLSGREDAIPTAIRKFSGSLGSVCQLPIGEVSWPLEFPSSTDYRSALAPVHAVLCCGSSECIIDDRLHVVNGAFGYATLQTKPRTR